MYPRSPEWTFDSDFTLYRKNGHQVMAVIPQ